MKFWSKVFSQASVSRSKIKMKMNISKNTHSDIRCCGVVVITAASSYSAKCRIRFSAGSNPAGDMLKFCNHENLQQCYQQEITLKPFDSLSFRKNSPSSSTRATAKRLCEEVFLYFRCKLQNFRTIFKKEELLWSH